MIARSPGQDPLLQGQGASQGIAGLRRIGKPGRDPQQVDRLVVIEPEPVDRGEQLRITVHQIHGGGTGPQAHRHPVESQHLLTVAWFQRQPLLARQQLSHGILGPAGGIDAGIEDGTIAAESGVIFLCDAAGQLLVALIAGSEKQPEPAVAVGGITPLQDTVIADRQRVAPQIPGRPGQGFEGVIGDGFEFARLTAGQGRCTILTPDLHGDEIVEHPAIPAAPIEGVEPGGSLGQLTLAGLDHPGLPLPIEGTGLDQARQQHE